MPNISNPARFRIPAGSNCPQRRSASSFERAYHAQDKCLNTDSTWFNNRTISTSEQGEKRCEYTTSAALTGKATGHIMVETI